MFPRKYLETYRSPKKLIDQVFVGMWFDGSHKPRYEDIIRKSILAVGLEPYRVDLPRECDSIPITILEGILNSRILLFEVSIISPENIKQKFRNANVMYELGIAHAWRMPEEIIVIKEDDLNLPFDTATFRTHKYDPKNEKESTEKISSLIKSAKTEIDRTKSMLVEKAKNNLDEFCLSLIGHYKGHYFSYTPQPDPSLDIGSKLTIQRLLDLGLIWLHYDKGKYAYHWTELGIDVTLSLGIEVVSENLW